MPPEETAPILPPVPDYTLLQLIGRGAYGDVWLARGATGMLRAVKVVWRDRFSDIEPYEREFRGLSDFIRHTQGEARQLALLHVGRNDEAGFFFYVMELADDVVTGGEIDPECYSPLTLKVLRDQTDYVPTADVIRYAIELTAGLAELHRAGLVHRDIKPSNVIMVDGRPKLADIGLVSVASEAMSFVGTEGFVPPEGPGTQVADIFSLGKVLYELVTGLDRQDFPSLPTDIADRSDRAEMLELNETIIKACAPRAGERYQDAESLLRELRLLDAGKSVRRLRFAEKGLARARRWIIAVGIVALIAGSGAAWERRRANIESAGRQAAEAELAELTRQTLYAASLASAQRALETNNHGLAREALERAVPQPGDPDLRGFEWHALHREARGDPAEIIRAAGDTPTRIEASPDGRWVAVDNTQPGVDIFDQNSGALVTALPGVHRVAGYSPDGARLIGTTPDYEIETWSIADGTPDLVANKTGINRPLQVHPGLPRVLYFEDSPDDQPHRLGIWNFERGESVVSWPITNVEGMRRWIFHNASASRDLRRVLLITTSNINADNQRHIRVINMETGEIDGAEIRGDRGNPLALSPDGERFVMAWGELHWGLSGTTRPQLRPLGHGSSGANLMFSRDGSRVIGSTYGNRVIEVTLQNDPLIRMYAGSRDQIRGVTFSADERFIWSASRSGEVRRWPRDRTENGAVMTKMAMPGGDQMSQLAVDSDSRFLAAVNTTAQLQMWRLAGLETLWSRSDLRQVISMTPTRLAAVSTDDQIVFIDTETGRTLSKLPPFPDGRPVYTAVASPSGRLWLVQSKLGDFALWDARTMEKIAQTPREDLGLEHHDFISFVVSDQGISLGQDTRQRLLVWDAHTGEILTSQNQLHRTGRISLSQDQKHVSLSSGLGASRILAFPSLALVAELPGSRSSGVDLPLHPDQPIVATQLQRGSISLYDYERQAVRPPLELPRTQDSGLRGQVTHLAFSPDGNVLVAADSAGFIRVWRR